MQQPIDIDTIKNRLSSEKFTTEELAQLMWRIWGVSDQTEIESIRFTGMFQTGMNICEFKAPRITKDFVKNVQVTCAADVLTNLNKCGGGPISDIGNVSWE